MPESNRFGIILIFMIILLLTPDTGPVSRKNEFERAIEQAKRELQELRNSTYGVPGNITGLEGVGKVGDDGQVTKMPPRAVQQTVKDMIHKLVGEVEEPEDTTGRSINDTGSVNLPSSEPNEDTGRALENTGTLDGATPRSNLHENIHLGKIELPVYWNISGSIYGDWHRAYNLPPYKLVNSTTEIEKNVTGNHGKISLRIEEAGPGSVQEVQARIGIGSEDGYSSQDIHLYGVHMVRSGYMVLSTNSREFSGVFALPHFTLSEQAFQASRYMLDAAISEAIKRQEDSGDANIPWFSSPNASGSVRCEYIVYIQLHPIHSPPPVPNTYPLYDPRFWIHYFWDPIPITPAVLRDIERELRHPTGAPVPSAPPITVSTTIYSPNCGYVLVSDGATGLKVEHYHRKVQNFALIASLIVGLQTWLLIRQMNESSTPSTVSRVSFWSIAVMAIVDGYTAGAFILVSVLVASSYLALVTAAFLSFVLVVVFGMRFLITIWGVQRPERRAAVAAVTPPAAELPTPATATAQTPLIIPANTDTNNNNDDGRQDISIIYSRFYFVLIGGAFLFLNVASWSPPYRHVFVSIFIFLACSFWVPQIYRNIMRGCRKALSWEFVLGTSATRISPVLYLFCWKDNIFNFDGDSRVGVGAAVWVALQIGILLFQEWAGPRCFIPGNLLPPAYDYHPILPVDDLEAAQPFSATPATPVSPSSSSATTATSHRSGLRSFDCAICMHPVDVLTSGAVGAGNVSSAGARGLGGLTTRRSYMVTPCRHVFHAPCLEGWMRFRLQCPICRNQLPPL
ncbi:hypothetical protein BDZ91DRAFT_773795 [Kalaharituber pfeilii]|nr:hypothetical protein BDZ91DRAFT_773795 [Kalaharituber pfeilii]